MEITKIIVIDREEKEFNLEMANQQYPRDKREDGTLYVYRLKNVPKDNRLHVAARWSYNYRGSDWALFDDYEWLMNCREGAHTWLENHGIQNSEFRQWGKAIADLEVEHHKDNQLPDFELHEEANIKNFWGEDLLNSVKELHRMHRMFKKENINDRRHVATLVEQLKTTPSSQDTSTEEAVMYLLFLSNAAATLEEQFKLTSRREIVKKWMYRIMGAILLAFPSAMLGLKAGPVGAVAGGVVGGCAGYKFGNRIGNYFSPVRAKSDHANVISAIVHKKIPRSK
jgi:hypothetical protein